MIKMIAKLLQHVFAGLEILANPLVDAPAANHSPSSFSFYRYSIHELPALLHHIPCAGTIYASLLAMRFEASMLPAALLC